MDQNFPIPDPTSIKRAGSAAIPIRVSSHLHSERHPEVPPDARIPLVVNGEPANPASARKQYAKVRPLSKLRPEMRGWTLDVLNLVRSLAFRHNARSPLATSHSPLHFTLADAYTLETHLAHLHPANRHIRPKIRQQLQVLRDLGLLTFLGHGNYTLK